MREVVFINIGQGGVQISNAIWELFCIEHNIGANGLQYGENKVNGLDTFKTVFHEIPNGQFVPRVVSVDLEPSVIDEVRTGSYRNLFHPDQLISGQEDASGNYARGHFTAGRRIIDQCLNQVRKVTQACDNLQGFILLNSLGGGTGSGFTTLLGEKLSIEYTKRPKYQVGIYPSPRLESSVVSPYNTIMNAYSAMDCTDMSVIMDNEATYGIASTLLLIQRPTFTNLNRLISQVLSSMTVSLRFENSLNSDLDQLCTNLIPYPRIHYPTSHLAPMQCQLHAEHETVDELELTRSVFCSSNSFIKIPFETGRLMACVMQYRGDVSPKSVNNAIFEIKRRNDINFVEWCPTGFKVGINSFPPATVHGSSLAPSKRSVTMLSNSTAIVEMWESLAAKFDLLYAKRSFVFWFVGEGMEEGEFSDARDNLQQTIQDYNEVGLTAAEIEEGEGEEKARKPPPVDIYSNQQMESQIYEEPHFNANEEPHFNVNEERPMNNGQNEGEEEEDYEEDTYNIQPSVHESAAHETMPPDYAKTDTVHEGETEPRKSVEY